MRLQERFPIHGRRAFAKDPVPQRPLKNTLVCHKIRVSERRFRFELTPGSADFAHIIPYSQDYVSVRAESSLNEGELEGSLKSGGTRSLSLASCRRTCT